VACAPAPGVARTSGILTGNRRPAHQIPDFAAAIGDLLATNPRLGAQAINPTDYASLHGRTEDARANVPPLKSSLACGPLGLNHDPWDIPLHHHRLLARRARFIYDPATIIAIVRRDPAVALDPVMASLKCSSAAHVHMRGTVVVGQPGGAVRLVFEDA
jgi:hypothetical protein